MTDDFFEEDVGELFERKYSGSVAMHDILALYTHFEEEPPQPVSGLMAAGLDKVDPNADSIWVGYEPDHDTAYYRSLLLANKHGPLRDLFEDMFE